MNYNLQPNESIIMKSDSVCHGGGLAGYTDELILTNLNIVLIRIGFWQDQECSDVSY